MPVTEAVSRVRIETTSTGAQKATADLHRVRDAQRDIAIASDRTTKATLSLDAALERSRRGLDAEYRATANARRETELWNRALRTGEVSLAEHSMRVSQVTAKYDQMALAGARASRSGVGGAFMGGLGGGIIGGAATFGIPMLIGKAREAVTAVDDLGDAAERAGVSGAKLQTLRYALEQNAGSAEDADSAFSRLNKTIGDVATGRNAAAAKVFQQLGIDVHDAAGNVKDTGLVFDDIADKIKALGTVQEDASRASVLFGKEAGPGLAALLQQGSAGVEKYSHDIVTYSQTTMKMADELDKHIKQLTTSWTVMFNTAAVWTGTAFFKATSALPDAIAGQIYGKGDATTFQGRQEQLGAAKGVATKYAADLAGATAGGSPAQRGRLAEALQEVDRLQKLLHYDPLSSVRAPGFIAGSPSIYDNVGTMSGSPGSFQRGRTRADLVGTTAATAKATDDLTKSTSRYVPVRQQANIADQQAADNLDRYKQAADTAKSRTDELAGSLKSLIDTALQGGNVFKALGGMLLDIGSDQLSKALAGQIGKLWAPNGGVPPINMAYDPLSSIGKSAPSSGGGVGGLAAPVGAVASQAMGAVDAMGGPPGAAAWKPFINASAAKFDVDPNVMTQVGKAEALGSSWQSQVRTAAGGRETSFGPFQLNTGGGLGDLFQKQTGLDLSNAALFNNPKNMQLYTDFVAKYAAMGGWSPWHGAANVGISNWLGIGGGLDQFGLNSLDWSGITSGILSMHGGGTVGAAGVTRSVPLAAFLNAPRYHSGLAPDERPAILQVGEEVRSRAQVARDRSGGSAFHYAPIIHVDARQSKMSQEEFRSTIEPILAQQQEQLKRDLPNYQRSSHLLRE